MHMAHVKWDGIIYILANWKMTVTFIWRTIVSENLRRVAYLITQRIIVEMINKCDLIVSQGCPIQIFIINHSLSLVHKEEWGFIDKYVPNRFCNVSFMREGKRLVRATGNFLVDDAIKQSRKQTWIYWWLFKNVSGEEKSKSVEFCESTHRTRAGVPFNVFSMRRVTGNFLVEGALKQSRKQTWSCGQLFGTAFETKRFRPRKKRKSAEFCEPLASGRSKKYEPPATSLSKMHSNNHVCKLEDTGDLFGTAFETKRFRPRKKRNSAEFCEHLVSHRSYKGEWFEANDLSDSSERNLSVVLSYVTLLYYYLSTYRNA